MNARMKSWLVVLVVLVVLVAIVGMAGCAGPGMPDPCEPATRGVQKGCCMDASGNYWCKNSNGWYIAKNR